MIEIEDVEQAMERVEGVAERTPLRHSRTVSEATGADVHLKYENLQRTGSFKIRGAYNKMSSLSDDEREAGVITASAGNHAQGVAFAAREVGVDTKIVMPRDAAISKVEATSRYGGEHVEIVLHGIDYDEAYDKARETQDDEGRVFVHPFDDEHVQAGQGTVGLEILDEMDVDTVIVAVGGGGLAAGVATAVKARSPDTRVIAAQAEGASSLKESLEHGEVYERDEVSTISDGIATRRVAESTFEVIKERVDEAVVVDDDETANAMLRLLERDKTVVEGAGAVPVAAAVERDLDLEGETVVPLLCGGNIDSNVLSQVINRGLINAGRYLKFETVLHDKPGALVDIATRIADHNANIYAIHHDRMAKDVTLNAAEVEFEVETRSREHANRLVRALENKGYDIEVLG
ncbi:MAG: threonine ammonia-lyase [Halobacteriales archaeon]|nr:threonine ammonia-lyase [Halobacteriales archaeon]